jgi:Xaa-Pro aminopeptidase
LDLNLVGLVKPWCYEFLELKPDFPQNEYEIRYAKARRLMAEEGLNALLATDITNYTYFGGHKIRLQMVWSRPQILILPIEGEPIVIAQSLFENMIRKTSWIKNYRLWEVFPFTEQRIMDVLKEFNLNSGKIGVDLGAEYRLGISYSEFDRLKKKLREVDFVDATNIFLKTRQSKTKKEIDCLKKACDITSKAYEKLFDNLKLDMSEIEIAKLMMTLMMEGGSDEGCWTNPRIFPGAYLMSEPTSRALREGDQLFIDSGAQVKNYKADFSRLAYVGQPSKELKELYELCREITWKEIEATKPGVKASDIAKIGSSQLKKAGIKPKPAGRDGHGLGIGGLELPSICLNDHTVLEEGMVVTMEPEVSSITVKPEISNRQPGFRFVQEENVLVTRKGYEVLSWSSRGLHGI